MTIEPINRPDGRHWCNPASADPEESPVTCPDCGLEWEFDGVNLWSIVGEILDENAREVFVEESAGD